MNVINVPIVPSKKTILLKPVRMETIGGSMIEAASAGGSEKDKPQVGEILAIGRGKLPIDGMKKGDIVAYRRYGDTRFLIKGQEYVFVLFDDLLGIIK